MCVFVEATFIKKKKISIIDLKNDLYKKNGERIKKEKKRREEKKWLIKLQIINYLQRSVIIL